MTPFDVLLSLAMYGPLALPLLYILTILLRVSCHFIGVEIPALGRAFFTTSLAALLSAAVALLLEYGLIGSAHYNPEPVPLFLALALALSANLLITTGLYRLLLPVRYKQALTLWLFQAGLFGAFLLVGGCCVGMILTAGN